MNEIGSVIAGGALTLVGIILGALLQYFVTVSNYKRQKRDDEEKYIKIKKEDTYYDTICFLRESQKHCNVNKANYTAAMEQEPAITAKLRLFGSNKANALFADYRDIFTAENYDFRRVKDIGLQLEKQIEKDMQGVSPR